MWEKCHHNHKKIMLLLFSVLIQLFILVLPSLVQITQRIASRLEMVATLACALTAIWEKTVIWKWDLVLLMGKYGSHLLIYIWLWWLIQSSSVWHFPDVLAWQLLEFPVKIVERNSQVHSPSMSVFLFLCLLSTLVKWRLGKECNL